MSRQRAPQIAFDEEKHRYTVNGQFTPSVTQIIKTQDPFEAGPWWGMRVGMSAVVRLLRDGDLSYQELLGQDPDRILAGHQDELEKLVLAKRLSVNHVRDLRGDEGTAIHYAINQIAETGSIPLLSDFDPELRGYIRAFSGWYADQDPEILWQEQVVASVNKPEGSWAGRADVATLAEKVEDADAIDIEDFKTMKGPKGPRVYPKFHLQGVGYKLAWNESLRWLPAGTPYCRNTASVVLHESGEYLRRVHCCPDERWLAAVRLWHDNEPFLDNLAKTENKSGKRRKR